MKCCTDARTENRRQNDANNRAFSPPSRGNTHMATPRFDDQFTGAMFARDPLPEPVSGGTKILDAAR